MHASMKRLHQISGKDRKIDIARDLNVSSATITNWSNRGVSKEGALDAASFYKVDANFILEGTTYEDVMKGFESTRHRFTDNHSLKDIDSDYKEVVLPILSSVSKEDFDGLSKRHVQGWIAKPLNLSPKSFALIVGGVSMLPEFEAGDQILVEKDISINNLKNGEFVVAQHKKSNYGAIRMVVISDGIDDMRLKQLNNDTGDGVAEHISEYDIIGVIDSKIIKYRK